MSELSMTRLFDAPVERVFDAWLNKSWGAWAGPPGFRGEVLTLEPKVGGRYRIAMFRPDGGSSVVGGVYREIDRPRRLVMSWQWEGDPNDTLITLDFRAVGDKTQISLKHEGFATADGRDNHQSGWVATLDKLAAHLGG